MDEKKHNNTASAYALALASYPEMAPYPNEMEYFDEKTGEFDSDGFDVVYDAWKEDRNAQRNQPEGYADGLEPFFARLSMVDWLKFTDSFSHREFARMLVTAPSLL